MLICKAISHGSMEIKATETPYVSHKIHTASYRGGKQSDNCVKLKARLHMPPKSPFLYHLKWNQCSPAALFTYNIKKFKGAAHKNGNVDAMCKQNLKNGSKYVTITKTFEGLWTFKNVLKIFI